MKYFLLIAGLFMVSCTGCFKKEEACTPVAPSAEESQIRSYATANGINAVKHNSGLFYEVLNPGTGATPNINSRVFITYTGKLLNGSQFDQGTNPANTGWRLGGLIEGWQVGLPLVKAGGKIRLIIPSSLAYGCNGAGSSIPPNAILFFEIDLVDVQ
jgi:FKBP-type peptidyl-prolyl cis-trans isomerase FkpA